MDSGGYVHRRAEAVIQKASIQFPVVLVTGPRQVGKTTLLKHLSEEDREYVSLDDPNVLELAKREPGLFMQRYKPPILIDEIQYAPGLLPYLKMAVDEARRPGMFWLTGSQQFHLMKGVSESLAGRVGIIKLLGMSWRMSEKGQDGPFIADPDRWVKRAGKEKLELRELFQRIWRGAFPELVVKPFMDRELFLGSYVQTYLQRDVRDFARVGDEMAFLTFLRACAARTAQMLNLSELARDTGISQPTAKAWLSILEASCLVYRLPPFFNNLTKRLVRTPKLYFLDTGLCSYLTGWSSAETLEKGVMAGPMLETWIFGEMLKTYWDDGKEAPFFYYRDKEKREIDLVMQVNGMLHPFEFKKTASPRLRDIAHFKALKDTGQPVGQGGIICLTKEAAPLTGEVWALPVSVI